MKKLVVLTGAGISAESGLSTFRDSGGLWEGYDVMQVASIDGWHRNKELVLEFYNMRRKQSTDAKPNRGHFALKELEKDFDVTIITQNVDDLHEKAGSENIIHLHGKLNEAKSSLDPSLIYLVKNNEINIGDKCEKGSQLRPNIVWFGEAVPMMEEAIRHVVKADILVIIGTSLVVYPAAGLLDYAPDDSIKYIIDPNIPDIYNPIPNLNFIPKKATTGVEKLLEELKSI
ncbi:NAD-dependent deacylase [soil metagenome]